MTGALCDHLAIARDCLATTCFADTPVGALAEFLRHEEITDAADLAGVRHSFWAVELPDDGYATPGLPATILMGDLATWRPADLRRLPG